MINHKYLNGNEWSTQKEFDELEHCKHPFCKNWEVINHESIRSLYAHLSDDEYDKLIEDYGGSLKFTLEIIKMNILEKQQHKQSHMLDEIMMMNIKK